jgi:hypothetical protein
VAKRLTVDKGINSFNRPLCDNVKGNAHRA